MGLQFKFNVPSKFFDPQPKVDSAIFEMKPHLKFQGMIKILRNSTNVKAFIFKKRKKIKNSVKKM